MRRTLTFALIVALVLVGCGEDSTGGIDQDLQPPSEITGVIVAIDSERLGDVESFDLKEGDTITTLYIDQEIEYPFPLGHLHEHLETAQPVHCEVEFRDGKLYAQTIEDA